MREVFLNRTVRILVSLCFILSGAVLVGWMLGVTRLISPVTALPPMQITTALGLFLGAISVGLLSCNKHSFAKMAAWILIVMSCLIIAEQFFLLELNLNIFFYQIFKLDEGLHFANTSTKTAFCLIIIGSTVLGLSNNTTKKYVYIFPVLLVGTSIISILTPIEYIFHLKPIYGAEGMSS